jgi:tetratricopeptide (TPR) repeat protein
MLAFIILGIALGICISPDSQVKASIDVGSHSDKSPLAKNPDEVCADCHREIYDEYEHTPMAQGSGNATDGLLSGGFLHVPSGIRYSVFLRDGKAWMSYERDGDEQTALHGEKQLVYYIGSGHRGRTYLYQENGQWFEAPINFYSKKKLWDMAPNYGATKTLPSALPVDSNCLHCHATDVQIALPEARNKYQGAPFLQGGIGCSVCHGDPSKHLAEHGHGPIVNPATLDPARRDSVCLQCHLEGDVAIYRAGKSLAQFHPGENLADYAIYFVKASAESGGGRATSQYEALLHSKCKIVSGDKLTCTTCHDPHSSPAPEDRVSYFRGKCLSCHTGIEMATKHHPEQQDCAACHMPVRDTSDISHEQRTDHDIRIQSPLQLKDIVSSDALVPVGGVPVGPREFGLAYAQLAEHGNRQAGEKAFDLLARAEQDGANDVQVHTQLGFLEQLSGDQTAASKEYAEALSKDPYDATAMANLAVIDAASGRTTEAINLLQRVVDADPNQLAAGLNLAFIECQTGNKNEALKILTRLSALNPDDPMLRKFVVSGDYGGQHCDLR